MLTKRIVACLDVRGGRNVKGVCFENLRDAGDAVELGRVYAARGIDELVFLDIAATLEKRQALVDLISRVAAEIDIPFTVGGGISSSADVEALLAAGADKVSVNSAAVRDPPLVEELALRFGSQCIVLAIDAKFKDGAWRVYIDAGRTGSDLEVTAWAQEGVARGAGEILLTSMDHDGVKGGFAVDLTRRVSDAVTVPVVASGGAGKPEHFRDIFIEGRADAALAASVFHFGEIDIPALKAYLREAGVPVRI